jgi:hypothetical protein
LTADAIGSILGLPELQSDKMLVARLGRFGVHAAFRSQRIQVGKTPNLTASVAIG